MNLPGARLKNGCGKDKKLWFAFVTLAAAALALELVVESE